MDHTRRVVFEPHDRAATHLCVFDGAVSPPGSNAFLPEGRGAPATARTSVPDARGSLLAVSTSVPAALPGIPASWPEWFGFALLGEEGIQRAVVNTRMVLHPRVRGTDFFARFRFMVLSHCRKAGYLYALHYCDPAMAGRYAALGHRLHPRPFEILPGLVRIPMLFDLRELDALAAAPKDAAPCGTSS